MIPYGHQSIDDDDIAAVVEVLKGEWLTQGPNVEAFEDALAAEVGARHAVAFANGTAALHAACAAGGLGPGSVVATSTLSFVASASCARMVGADVRLLDIDPSTLNVDPLSVPADVDALVAVHFAGLPMDLEQLPHRPRLVIEDAAHALGASTSAAKVGSCVHSDMCCFSFHPVKTITTGEGGAVTTNDDGLAERLRRFRNHGMERRPDVGPWAYEVNEIGFNYRLTDLQAALGLSQMRKLERFLARRRALADRYRRELADAPLVLPPAPPDGVGHAYHLFTVRVADRDRIFGELRDRGIGVQVHYIPIHHQPAFARWAPGPLPAADDAHRGLLSLPLHPDLSDADQDRVIEALRDVL